MERKFSQKYIDMLLKYYKDAQELFRSIYIGKVELLLHRKHATHYAFRRLPGESAPDYEARRRAFLSACIVPLPVRLVENYTREVVQGQHMAYLKLAKMFAAGMRLEDWGSNIPYKWKGCFVADVTKALYLQFKSDIQHCVIDAIVEDRQSEKAWIAQFLVRMVKMKLWDNPSDEDLDRAASAFHALPFNYNEGDSDSDGKLFFSC